MIERLRAFTYARQRLGSHRAAQAATALRDVVGVYSSHPSAPLSLHARTRAMSAADFRGLEAVRLPAMRGSIHLLPRGTGHLAFRAVPASAALRVSRLRYAGSSPERYEELRPLIVAACSEPRTVREITAALGVEDKLSVLVTALAIEGVLVRVGAPGLRSNALRYVVADVPDADPSEALAWLAGEYVRAFGPVRPEDFRWWSGAPARRADAALAAHETVDVGDGYLLRARDARAFAAADPPPPDAIDLLPKWDALTMGYAPDGRARLADDEVVGRCYDPRGDGLPLVLHRGRAIGTWSIDAGAELFDGPAGPRLRGAVDERLTAVRALLAG